MHAFLTGSRKYGVPTPSSDIDLVVLMNPLDLWDLRAASGDLDPDRQPTVGYLENASLRFGGLNLICCTDMVSYELWAEGTRRLTERKPVSRRSEAVKMFDSLREKIQPPYRNGNPVRLFNVVVENGKRMSRDDDFWTQIDRLEQNPSDWFSWGVLSDWLVDRDEPELAHAARIVRDREVHTKKTNNGPHGDVFYFFMNVPASIAVHWSCFGLDVSTLAGALGVLARAILKAKEDVA